MMRVLTLICLLGGLASAQEGDAISTQDGRGNISTVLNLFDGQRTAIQITRLTATGYVQWTQQHSDGMYEKAHAAAMDGNGSAFIAGVRRYDGRKYALLLKYNRSGGLAQEWADTNANCNAMAAAVDVFSNVTMAAACNYGQGVMPVRVLHFNNDGVFLWADDFDGGGRNYVRGLSPDVQGNISLAVETVSGGTRDGSYVNHIVVYNQSGARIEVR